MLALVVSGCTGPTVVVNPPEDKSQIITNLPPEPPNKLIPESTNPALQARTTKQIPLELNPPSEKGPIRIGLLLPLSGVEKALGRSMLDAATLALHDFGSERLILIPKDTKGTSSAASVAAEIALQEGAQLLLGPVFSESVAAAALPAQNRDINIVAFSTDPNVAGNGVYLLAFLAQQEVDRVISYATSKGIERFAILAPETPYGISVVDALRLSTINTSSTLSDVTFYLPDAPSAMDAVEKLANYQIRRDQLFAQRRALRSRGDNNGLALLEGRDTFGEPPFQAVMLPEGGGALRQIAPLLPFFDIDPEKIQFLGTGLWDDPSLVKEPSLIGGWFAAPPPKFTQQFVDKFSRTFGYKPPRIASLAYDAVALVSILIRDYNSDFSDKSITSPSGFKGIDGIFRFQQNGIVERGLAIIEVREDGLVVLDPPPTNFEVN